MKNIIAILVCTSVLASCSAIKGRSITNDLKGLPLLVDRVALVCSASNVLGIGNADKCLEVVDALDEADRPVVYDTAECIEDYKDPASIKTCVSALEGWGDLYKELSK